MFCRRWSFWRFSLASAGAPVGSASRRSVCARAAAFFGSNAGDRDGFFMDVPPGMMDDFVHGCLVLHCYQRPGFVPGL